MTGLGFKTSNVMTNSSARKTRGIKFVKEGKNVKGHQTFSSFTSDSSSSQACQGSKNPASTNTISIPSIMSGHMKSVNQISNSANFKNKTMSSPHQASVKSEASYSSLQSHSSRSIGDYLESWESENDSYLKKLRRLAYMVVTRKKKSSNAVVRLSSAADRMPIHIEINTLPVFGGENNTCKSFCCYVYIEGVRVASGQGAKRTKARTNAYENALQNILMPYLRIIPIDPTSKELQASGKPFTSQPPEPSKVPLKTNQLGEDQMGEVRSQHHESNLESTCLKSRRSAYKPIGRFILLEPMNSTQESRAAHTLSTSADFNHMSLKYEYFFKDTAVRCVLRIENEVLADTVGTTRNAAKYAASVQALLKLRRFCWVIKTKQVVDANTNISKKDMLNKLNDQSGNIKEDNIGNKILRKMGWSGGGVGKDGSGIVEPVSLEKVINREGFGLRASMGVTEEFRKRVREVIEAYAIFGNQEDLVLSSDFNQEERGLIHDECRRLNLRSKSYGKKQKKYLCIGRKRSVDQLLSHLISVGGETVRYKLMPPGQDVAPYTENSDQGTNQKDLEFSSGLNQEERKIFPDECRKLDLVSQGQGGKEKKYPCVHRKTPKTKKNKSSNHVMSCGGERAHFQLVPPGVALHTENSDQGTIDNSQWNAEPLSPITISREDLGLSAVEGIGEFRKKVKEVIVTYEASGNQKSLEFSSDFTQEERKIIHFVCRKLNLVSKSRGGKEERCLRVRRKKPKTKIIKSSNHEMSFGDETTHSPGTILHTEISNLMLPKETIYYSQFHSSESSSKVFSPSLFPNKINSTIPSFIKDASQCSTLHGSFVPNQRSNNDPGVPSRGRGGNESYNSQTNRLGLFGNCPHGSQFLSNFDNGGLSFQNNETKFQSPEFVRALGDDMGETPCQMDLSTNHQSDIKDGCRPNGAMDDAGFLHQNIVNNIIYPGYNNSFDPRPEKINVQGGLRPRLMTTGFKQNNVNVMNQYMDGFRGNNDIMSSMARTGFGDDMEGNRMSPRMDEYSLALEHDQNDMIGPGMPSNRNEFSIEWGFDNDMGIPEVSSESDDYSTMQGFDYDMRGPRILSGRDEYSMTQRFDGDIDRPRMLLGRDEYSMTQRFDDDIDRPRMLSGRDEYSMTQRFDNDLRGPRMPSGRDGYSTSLGYDSDMDGPRMPMGRDEIPGPMHRMMNDEWDVFRCGRRSSNRQWDVGADDTNDSDRNDFAHDMDTQPDQYAQRRRMHMCNFNPSMRELTSKLRDTDNMNSSADVESFRDEYESNTEWGLRRQFLEANLDELPLERLICLSRCFINMTVYNCSYPNSVMVEVHHRSRGLLSSDTNE